jgi:predicted RNase H-like HicB family nuclease
MTFTAKYTKIDSGYLGQLVEWPEVVTEGEGIEECRAMLRDALRGMILAYQRQGKEIPLGSDLFEQVSVSSSSITFQPLGSGAPKARSVIDRSAGPGSRSASEKAPWRGALLRGDPGAIRIGQRISSGALSGLRLRCRTANPGLRPGLACDGPSGLTKKTAISGGPSKYRKRHRHTTTFRYRQAANGRMIAAKAAR